MIKQETKALIDKLLLEKLPLAGIARVTGVSDRWLLSICQYVIQLGAKSRRSPAQKKGQLTIECDVPVVICSQQEEQTVERVGIRYRDKRNCWYLYW